MKEFETGQEWWKHEGMPKKGDFIHIIHMNTWIEKSHVGIGMSDLQVEARKLRGRPKRTQKTI